MKLKMKKKEIARRLVKFALQLLFFIIYPQLFVNAFSAIKYMCAQIAGNKMVEWNPFVETLVILLAITMVFGRVFCGYACAFGSLGDWLFSLSAFAQKKLRGKVLKLPPRVIGWLSYLKYAVLLIIIAACLTGTYGYISAADPWELFAVFRAGNFSIEGRAYMAATLGIIVIGMIFVERFFCALLCPMGAIFALMPVLPLAVITEGKDCVSGCSRCSRECPAGISPKETSSRHGECFQCGKCVAACPNGNLKIGAVMLLARSSVEKS
jgi:polyferredoxin